MAEAAQYIEAPPHYSSSSILSRPGGSDPSTLPWRDQHPRYPGSSSASIRTQPRARSTAGAAGALVQSRANPPSPRQERAAIRAARRYPRTPEHRLDSRRAPPQGATTGDRGDPATSTKRGSTEHHATVAAQFAAGAGLEEPRGATNPQPAATQSSTRPSTSPQAASSPDATADWPGNPPTP